jgi:hypothetical protein
MADDLLTSAWKHISNFGPKAFDWLVDKFFPAGLPEIGVSVTHPTPSTARTSRTSNITPSAASLTRSTVLLSGNRYHLDAINLDYVLATLCPEEYSSRHPCKSATKVAIANSRYEVPMVVNTNGNGAVFFFPQ